MSRGNRIAVAGAVGFTAAVIARELRRPAAERQWHGRLAGVPYDLRPPTLERVRRAWWSPDDPRILMPRAVGIGWDVNVGRLVALARRR